MFEISQFIDRDCLSAKPKKKVDKKGLINLSSNELLSIKLNSLQRKFIPCSSANQYPYYPRVRNKISELLHLDPDRVEFYAGSDSAIYYLLDSLGNNLDALLLTYPNYENYFSYAKLNKIPIVLWRIDSESLNFCAAKGIELIDNYKDSRIALVVTNPNGFTGQLLETDVIKTLAEHLHHSNGLLILDLAYISFSKDELSFYTNDLCKEYDNIILVNTLSKSHGLAAARFGYLYGDPKLMSYIRQWNGINAISGFTYDLVEYYLRNENFIRDLRRCVISNRRIFESSIQDSSRLNVTESQGNFIFLTDRQPDEVDRLDLRFLKEGYIIRRFESKLKLNSSYRITVPADFSPKICNILSAY